MFAVFVSESPRRPRVVASVSLCPLFDLAPSWFARRCGFPAVQKGKRVPAPFWTGLTDSMAPLHSSMRFCTMAKPKPVP